MAEFSSIAARDERAAPQRGLAAWAPEVLIFLLVAAALLFAEWHLIELPHLEVGDFAANSLLIERAKSLHLWIGNYSRVGFNHPGPAILYVLAAGELLFFDQWHLLASPFSGQMVAAILYNAFWIALIFGMLRRIGGSFVFAALVTAIFLFVVARQNFQFFTGMWFPELYFFPFAAMLIAASRFANGRTDMLPALALSAGFLINGHVSFVATLGIIFLLSLGYNRANFGGGSGASARYVLGAPYWSRNQSRVTGALILLALFFLPLLVETVRHFPGPIAQYLAVGRGHHANRMVQAYRYTAQYWGGTRQCALGMVLLIAAFVLSARFASRPFIQNLRAVWAVLLAASVAMLFYAKAGVDMLDQEYIGYFYYAVPAFAMATGSGCLYDALAGTWKAPLALVVALGLCVPTYLKLEHNPTYADLYTQPQIAGLYQALAKVQAPGQRLVLDLDNSTDWGDTWSTILGVEHYAHRQGVDLLCVNRNWHISFTVWARCTPTELANNTRLVVTQSGLQTGGAWAPLVDASGLAFYRYPVLIDHSGDFSVQGHSHLYGAFFLGDGWSGAESEFVWMQQTEAHLTLALGKGYTGTVILDLSAFLPHPDSVQKVSISVNDGPAVSAQFDAGSKRQKLTLALEHLPGDVADIKLVDHDLISPKAAGLSDDPRTLGVALYGFEMRAK